MRATRDGGADLELDGGLIQLAGWEWAVPALVLSVPGLLLVLAVLAQSMASLVWLPLVRRWLGEFGLLRRRRRPRPAG